MSNVQEPLISNTTKQPVAFLVGRMNPPTPGHIELIHELLTFASSIDAIPQIYITQSSNASKMTNAQKRQPIIGLAAKKEDATLTTPYVKHKNYENPLTPDSKKKLIQLMLLNKYGIPESESAKFVISETQCNGLFKAMWCARKTQPDPEKLYFVMGEEIDDSEKESRESFCLTKSSGEIVAQDENGMKVNCRFVKRTSGEGISGLSGSKVRLLAAKNDLQQLFEVYEGYLTQDEVKDLVQLVHTGLNLDLNPTTKVTPTKVTTTSATGTRKRQKRTMSPTNSLSETQLRRTRAKTAVSGGRVKRNLKRTRRCRTKTRRQKTMRNNGKKGYTRYTNNLSRKMRCRY